MFNHCGPIFANAITICYNLDVFFYANFTGITGFVSCLDLGNGFTCPEKLKEKLFHGRRHI